MTAYRLPFEVIQYRLSFEVIHAPDFVGGDTGFFVESGREFDVADYAEAYGLNLYDIDARDVHAAQDAAARLGADDWLSVTHSAG